MKQRIIGLDLARFVAVMAVILSHTLISTNYGGGGLLWLSQACFSFDLPLFLIVTGYLAKPEPITKGFVLKQVRTLLVPYFVTGLLVMVCATLLSFLIAPGTSMHVLGIWALATLFGYGVVNPFMLLPVPAIGAIWYLLALFVAKLILSATSHMKLQPLVLIGLFLVGVLTMPLSFLPWSIQPGLCSALYLWVGQQVKKYDILTLLNSRWLLGAGVVVTVVNAAFFGRVGLVQAVFPDGPVASFVLGSVASITILKFCQLAGDFAPRALEGVVQVAARLGQLTLPMFCMHLLELNVFPWFAALVRVPLGPRGQTFVLEVLRLVLIGLLMAAVYAVPMLRKVYYPQRITGKTPHRRLQGGAA